jgi:GTP cyclohydrolase III
MVPSALELTDIEPIVEDVRHRHPVELRVSLLVREPLIAQRLTDRVKRVQAGGVQFEEPRQRRVFSDESSRTLSAW